MFLQQFGGGGCGQGHAAVGAFDPAHAGGDGAGLDAGDVEQDDAGGGGDDIDDGVESADLVKVDLGDLDAVNAGLSLGQLLEDAAGQVGLRGGEGRAVDDGFDVVEVAVGVLGLGDDLGVGGAKATAFDGLKFELDGQLERADDGLEGLGIDASVDQGAQGHVARDTAEAVEVEYPHRRLGEHCRLRSL